MNPKRHARAVRITSLRLPNPTRPERIGSTEPLGRVQCHRRGKRHSGIVMQWNDDLTQYAGHFPAGMIAALI
jgi:hypothetical protein